MDAEGVADILDFHFWPYGNARGVPPNMQCQHGADECTANTYEACVIGLYPDTKDWWPYVHCLESSEGPQKERNNHRCIKKAGLDTGKVLACQSNSTMSNAFVNAVAKQTNSLQPAHQFTPWVTLFNTETRTNTAPVNDTDKLLQLICAAYGGPKPEGCPDAAAVRDAAAATVSRTHSPCPADW